MKRLQLIFLGCAIVILLAACQNSIVSQGNQNSNQGVAGGVSGSGGAVVPAQQAQNPEPSSAASGPACKCTDEYDPVCANGQLVINACTADCMGIKGYAEGECNTLAGKQLFPCGTTTGGLSAQHNPVCGRVIETETGITYWRTYPNALTACQVSRATKLEVKEFTRGECG